MNNIIKQEDIEKKIYTIRGVEVMLDSDLAEIYKCANGTKTINQAVKRNIDRFPDDFYFQLNDKEYFNLKSQIGTTNIKKHGGIRKLPFVFTEQGVAMLSTVIRTEIASEVSINIMRAFVHMRHYLKTTTDVLPYRVMLLEEKVDNNTKKINELFNKFESKLVLKDKIIYKGELFDSHVILLDIFDTASEEIIIFDNYAGKELLKSLKEIKKNIIVISSNIDNTLKEKYERQYNNVKFIINNTYHDRFILIDRKRLYHSGASFKDLGKKCFDIHEIDDKQIIKGFITNLPKNI